MFATLLGLLTGLAGPIVSLVSKLTDLNIAKVNASSDEQKALIQQQIDEAEDRKAVLIAEAGSRLNAYVRMFITAGPACYIFKLFFWDKVIGSLVGCAGTGVLGCWSFTTDPISPQMWTVLTAIIAFYFVYDITSKLRK